MKKFILNGKEYEINEKVDFGTICELEEAGVELFALGKGEKTFSQIRNLIAYFTGLTKEEANEEIEEHLLNGGSLDQVSELIGLIAESDFFQKMVAMQNKKK